MRKNNSVPLRSALGSFHGIKQHLKDTNQLFESLESKIVEIKKEAKKKVKKPSQKLSKSSRQQPDRFASSSQFSTTAYPSEQKSQNYRFFASNVTSPEYRQHKTFAREELYDSNYQNSLSQKNSPSSISRFYHSEIKNLLDEKYKNLDRPHHVHQDPPKNREYSQIDSRTEINNREEKLRRNKDHIKNLEAEIQNQEESRATLITEEQPRHSANTKQLGNYYQLKLQEIQSQIARNDAEISYLTEVNENLKTEMKNIKHLLEAESAQNQRMSHHSNKFEEDCNKIYSLAVETFGTAQNENELDIKRRIKLEKYNSQRQNTHDDVDLTDKEDAIVNDHQFQAEEENQSNHQQQEAQMNVLFELVSRYQVDMEQVKRDNLLVQERLQQEILELKDQLSTKHHEPEEVEERPTSNQRSSAKSFKEKSQVTDYFEVMEKDDLAKYAKGLQDTYTTLEQQHLEAIEENKRLKQQLNAVNEPETSQHESNLYNTDSDRPHLRESAQSFSRKTLERWDEYQHRLRTTPLDHHDYPHKHLSPIKDSSEKDFSKFLIPTPKRKEIPSEYSDLRNNLKHSPQKLKPKKKKKSNLNSSFEDADEFMDQINRVKELVQYKIAENDAEISDQEGLIYPPKRMCQTEDNFATKTNKKKVSQKER